MPTDEDDDVVLRSVHNELQAEFNDLKAKYEELLSGKKPTKKKVAKSETNSEETVIYVTDDTISNVIADLGFEDV